MGKSLVSFDTNHIKQYVFATDKLREIRGGSSILDNLNREGMRTLAEEYQAEQVYANGGSGMFLIDSDKAETFGKAVQRMYHEGTGGGASITYAIQVLPADITTIEDAKAIGSYRDALGWRLREQKQIPPKMISFATHPFMRPCDSCGVFYASPEQEETPRDPGEQGSLFCESCQEKRRRDKEVKDFIEDVEANRRAREVDHLWSYVIQTLRDNGYDVPPGTERPNDFNVFSTFKSGKDYLALIYADANGMGKAFDACKGLPEYRDLATDVDKAIYNAVCMAISAHLKISDHVKDSAAVKERIFPFDILMMGGDDVLMVTPASAALDVAMTLERTFRELTQELTGKKYTLSVGVVLAPIKYPFRLLESLATTTLKFAKDDGNGEPRINFVTVAGSAGETFEKAFAALHTPAKENGHLADKQFFATLRPYKPQHLERLLVAIRKGRGQRLGRTKLHQMREAIMKKNLTTSLSESRAVLRNWTNAQRDYVIQAMHDLTNLYLDEALNSHDPEAMQFNRPFPWFESKEKKKPVIYRTPLLDFIELYDFVSGEEAADGGTH